MIKFVIFLLTFFSFVNAFANSENKIHSNLYECVETLSEDSGLIACVEEYEIVDLYDCKEHLEMYTSENVDANKFCNEISMKYDIELYLKDRPSDFFDLISSNQGSVIRSFGCSVTYDDKGAEEFNTKILVYEGTSDEIIKEDFAAQRAIVHINKDLGYAEVNYGSTIFPIAEQRFFTNELREDTDDYRFGGFVNDEIDSVHKGGTDRGPYGGGWIIDSKDMNLHIFAGQYQIVFTENCDWNNIKDKLE